MVAIRSDEDSTADDSDLAAMRDRSVWLLHVGLLRRIFSSHEQTAARSGTFA